MASSARADFSLGSLYANAGAFGVEGFTDFRHFLIRIAPRNVWDYSRRNFQLGDMPIITDKALQHRNVSVNQRQRADRIFVGSLWGNVTVARGCIEVSSSGLIPRKSAKATRRHLGFTACTCCQSWECPSSA